MESSISISRRISKMTIRDFLYFDKQNEKKMFRDSKKRNVIFVLSIILGAISLFLWNSRCTMDNFNKQETLTYLMVSVIMLIISIYGICGIDIRVLDDDLAEALKKLPERKRNTLLMYYFLEMTESEIANLQKITQSGVFRNRHHALETMKKILKEKQ